MFVKQKSCYEQTSKEKHCSKAGKIPQAKQTNAVKKLLEDEYHLIGNEINVSGSKKHNVKLRKKTIYTEEIHNNDI